MSMSTGYSSRNWECPFFKWDKKGAVYCEGGRVTLPPRELNEYIGRYCGSCRGWRDCPQARALTRYYERME